LIDLVEDHEDEDVPLVVFSAHVEPLNQLAERDGWEKITGATSAERRQQIVNEFQAGNLKGVAVSIKAGGVGLTLTRAWKAIFVDLDWVPGANQQAEDRICRIGQESQKVEIVRMVSNHVMDLHVLELIHLKNNLIEKSVEKTTEIEQPEQISETEEEFQKRMVRASFRAEGSNELYFPEFIPDPVIPF
jgi:SNF2 family DNA or RNA helicase